MDARAPDREVDLTVTWADRAESASVVCGTVATVLAFGLVVATAWFAFWGLSPFDVAGFPLAAAIDVVLVLLAVTFHLLAVDLGGR